MTIARTPSGQPITCDGCGIPVEEVTDAMQHPVPTALARANYGKDHLVYIVCPPRPDGRQPCLDAAQHAEELYDQVRCRKPGCTGTDCHR